nr:hypothetical protein [Micromonospora sp. DSM 115978]
MSELPDRTAAGDPPPARSRPMLRWLVPAGVAAVLVGGGAAVGVFSAAAEPSLPPRTAAELLVDLQTSRLGGLSGTMVQRADLGLPALPGLGAQGTANLSALAVGTNTVRVWYAGPEQVRLAVLGTLGETDVIRNGSDLWIWNSRTNEAQHRVLGDREPDGAHRGGPAGLSDLPLTPQQAADQALAAIDPSTEVSVGRSATVAGRDAYELILDPRDDASLVGQVRIAIDATEHVPLRFEVLPPAAEEAAFEVAFTQVDFARPDPEQFAFNPPAGTTVTEPGSPTGAAPDGTDPDRTDKASPGRTGPGGADGEAAGWTTSGSGWTTVLILPVGDAAANEAEADGLDLATLLAALPAVSGDWGTGRLLSSTLFSALLTDDGRLLVGAVTPERLYEVASVR